MNIQEIISEIKNLSEEDIIKFNKEFTDFYKPYKKKETELKKIEKEKEESIKLKKTIEIGDKICELWGIKGFPVSSVYKANDAPYETYEDAETYVLGDCNIEKYLKIDESIEDNLMDLFEKFYNNMSDKQYLDEKKDGRDLYPGDTIYNFYIKGGTFKKVMDNELDDIF